MSVPLLPTGERSRANGASPAILRDSDGWCDSGLDRDGWHGKVRQLLGVDEILGASPLHNRLSGLRKNKSTSDTYSKK